MPQSLSAVYIHLVFSTKDRRPFLNESVRNLLHPYLWLKENYSIRDFEWQGGYADFSVSASNLEQVKKYILNQHKHHHKINFQDELRTLLRRHRVEWDERYIWD